MCRALLAVFLLSMALAIDAQVPIEGPFQILEVAAGDTLVLATIGRVRLVGVSMDEQSAQGSLDVIRHLVENKRVWVQMLVSEKDSFGRMAVYLYLEQPDGNIVLAARIFRMANLEVVRSGWSDPFSDRLLPYEKLFFQAVRQAKQERLGIWANLDRSFTRPTVPPYRGPFDPRGPDRDCGDFATQAEAQAFFEAAKPGDRHKLDFDDNDIACENRP